MNDEPPTNLSPDERAAAERRGHAMRAVGAYGAIGAILKDIGPVCPPDIALARLHEDLSRWANKAALRAWELADG